MVVTMRSLISFFYIVICASTLLSCGSEESSVQSSGNNVTGRCTSAGASFDSQIFLTPGIHLFVFGDTGTGTENQQLVANIVDDYHLQFPLDGIIHTGDVFYPSGIQSLSDTNIQYKFNDIYQPLNIFNIPWYFVAGNHDYDGSISALLDFADSQPQFNYPKRYYSAQLKDKNSEVNVTLLAADTTPFTQQPIQLEQLAWLNNQLIDHQLNNHQLNNHRLSNHRLNNEQSTTIVFGHHPIRSSGAHGDTEVLKTNFLSLLQHYQVPLYLSGHEHSLEYLYNTLKPHMLVSGAGGQNLRDIKCQQNSLYSAKLFGGFALYVTNDKIKVIVVNELGIGPVFDIIL